MRNPIRNNQAGFTIMEILLYLSLSVVMVVLISGIGVNVLSGLMSTKAEEEIQYNAQFINEKIRILVGQADGIFVPARAATSTSLSLVMSDPGKNPTVINVLEGSLQIQEGSGDPEPLSGSGVVISDVEFSNVTYEGGSGSVRIKMNMGLYNPGNRTVLRASTTLYTTVNLQYP